MPDYRRLLAKLNPRAVNFLGAGGGAPEHTTDDLNGALGMVSDGLGRQLLEACWVLGPGHYPTLLMDTMKDMVHKEWTSRRIADEVARLSLHIAEEDLAFRRNPTHDQKMQVTRLKLEAEGAKLRAWPYNPEVHVQIRRAVLDEIRGQNHCETCQGRESVWDGDLSVTCPECNGRGFVALSGRKRAEMIGLSEGAIRNTHQWVDLYEWLLGRCRQAERYAGEQFERSLGIGLDKAA
ncbi:hypothetical protein [Solilutibacter silvestris]|uniref:hypothetical protein n=1 Tax=Solilutibacter silvestris TaxID=1645665 RepID=UPI003D331958